jgi:leader peptidase (prepilin peptidase)/N-methyltransferase
MSLNYLLRLWPWWLSGAWVGLWLAPLGRIISRKVLQRAQASPHEWQGPGGGLEQPVPFFRHIWVPLVNASLWACVANGVHHPTLLAVFLWASMTSTLVLLALMDWDVTLLPDWVVFPLGLAGLFSSYAGITPYSLLFSALSAFMLLGLMGGFAWVFRSITGNRGIGGGDLKLLAVLTLWCGFAGVLYIVLWASVINVVWNLAWRYFKGFSPQAEWPFGPSIVIATLAWVLSHPF